MDEADKEKDRLAAVLFASEFRGKMLQGKRDLGREHT
jgi:hypothetical protein